MIAATEADVTRYHLEAVRQQTLLSQGASSRKSQRAASLARPRRDQSCDSWSPAPGAQFSVLPPDNATGNFTKVVQRTPVKIVFEPNSSIADLLRPGMSVVAMIHTSPVTAEPAASKH